MIQRLLTLVDEIFPVVQLPMKGDVRTLPIGASVCQELQRVAGELIAILSRVAPGKHLSRSVCETLVPRLATVELVTLRYRPESTYYAKVGGVVPTPENPVGPSATGIALQLQVHRGYRTSRTSRQACCVVELEIWGHHERACFRQMFFDHRRTVERLVDAAPFVFFTSCVFPNIEEHRGKDAFDKLSLYCDNEQDDEGQFSLSIECGSDAMTAEVFGAFATLMVLYEMAYGYCRAKKDKDRGMDFLSLLPVA